MRVECLNQCDIRLAGGQRKALFPGQFYELDDPQMLVETGHVVVRTVIREAREALVPDRSVPASVRIRGRGRA